jgi:hypothetical protein
MGPPQGDRRHARRVHALTSRQARRASWQGPAARLNVPFGSGMTNLSEPSKFKFAVVIRPSGAPVEKRRRVPSRVAEGQQAASRSLSWCSSVPSALAMNTVSSPYVPPDRVKMMRPARSGGARLAASEAGADWVGVSPGVLATGSRTRRLRAESAPQMQQHRRRTHTFASARQPSAYRCTWRRKDRGLVAPRSAACSPQCWEGRLPP